MNWIVAVLGVITVLDVPQRARQMRDATEPQRLVVGGALVGIAAAFAALATPVLDALDISSPTMEVGAGVVLGLWSLAAMVRWDEDPVPDAVAGGLVPLLFPIVLTPAVGVTVVAVAARNGWWLPVAATATGAVPIAVAAAGNPIAHRPLRALSATIGTVIGVAMIVDGAYAV